MSKIYIFLMINLSLFKTLKLPVIINNLKHLFIENLSFSGVFTHYESYLDQTYKKSLMDTLLFCCFSTCSDYTSFHLEVENLREIFKKNSYPSRIIEQSIRYLWNKLYVPKKVIPTVSKKERFIVLPYLETLSSN